MAAMSRRVVEGGATVDEGRVLRIECDECVARRTAACRDCVVSFLLASDGEAMVFDVAEARALRLLSSAGLAPALRHRRRTG
jgi:hypothetical protein